MMDRVDVKHLKAITCVYEDHGYMKSTFISAHAKNQE
jgi:hypothetical protein